MGPIVHYQLVVLHWMIFNNYQGTEKRTCQIFQTQKIPKRKISNCHIWKVKLVSMRRVIDCLQSAFSLKICLVLDLIQHDWVPRCYYIGIEMRWEKTDCWLFCSKQTLRQPRNGVTDWSIAQLLTDNWLVCVERNSHASHPAANYSEPSSNLSNKTFKDILQEETAVNFLKGNKFKAILLDLKKV